VAEGQGRRRTATRAFERLMPEEADRFAEGLKKIRAAGGSFEHITATRWAMQFGLWSLAAQWLERCEGGELREAVGGVLRDGGDE